METITIIGWAIAVGMGVINIIIAYLVIPTRTRIDRLQSHFEDCRRRGIEAITELKGQNISQTSDQAKNDVRVEALNNCMNSVKIALARIEAEQSAQREAMQKQEKQIELILREVRRAK